SPTHAVQGCFTTCVNGYRRTASRSTFVDRVTTSRALSSRGPSEAAGDGSTDVDQTYRFNPTEKSKPEPLNRSIATTVPTAWYRPSAITIHCLKRYVRRRRRRSRRTCFVAHRLGSHPTQALSVRPEIADRR